MIYTLSQSENSNLANVESATRTSGLHPGYAYTQRILATSLAQLDDARLKQDPPPHVCATKCL